MRHGRAVIAAMMAALVGAPAGPQAAVSARALQAQQDAQRQQAPAPSVQPMSALYANLGYGPALLRQSGGGCPWPGRRVAWRRRGAGSWRRSFHAWGTA